MKKSYSIILTGFFIILMLAPPAFSMTYATSDLQGTWSGQWLETTRNADVANDSRYWLHIWITIDENGSISGGEWDSSGGASGTISGGSMTLTEDGDLSGIITYIGAASDTISIPFGWMDNDKNMAYITMEKHGGQLAAGMLSKMDNAAGATDADLEGTWAAVIQEGGTGPNSSVYWIDTSFTLNALGNGTGAYNYRGQLTGTFDPVQFDLAANNRLTGNMTDNYNNLTTVNYGQLNLNQNTGTIASTKPDGGSFKFGAGSIIRTGSTGFTDSDLRGTWAIYHTRVFERYDMTWRAGQVSIDASGTIIDGYWEDHEGTTGSYASGSLSVSDAGVLSGQYVMSDHPTHTLTLEGGQMGLTKTFGGLVSMHGIRGETNYTLDTVFMIKKTATTNNIVPVNSLLLD